MPDVARRWTIQEVQALPWDGNRYEVVDGELLVTPSPIEVHQRVLLRLAERLLAFLRPQGLAGLVYLSPADITWPDVLVQPDLFVVHPDDLSTDWRTFKRLLLAVEVLSPSSRRGDRVVKRRAYQRNAVATYWVVDPVAHVVEVWHPLDEAPDLVTATLGWRVAPDAPEASIDLAEVFAPPSPQG